MKNRCEHEEENGHKMYHHGHGKIHHKTHKVLSAKKYEWDKKELM